MTRSDFFWNFLMSLMFLAFFGFYVLLIVMLAAPSISLVYLSIYVISLTAFAVLNGIWGFFKPKSRNRIILVSMCAMGLLIASTEYSRVYRSRYSVHDEYDKNTTYTIKLNEPLELLITENIPILDGATALQQVYTSFAANVFNTTEYAFYSTTPHAFERLINGEVDIIIAAAPSESQLQAAKDAGKELTLTPIGREAFVFFVNSENPVSSLSIDDIKRIYSGKSTNWKEFGGTRSRIVAFQRNEGSGSQTALISLMSGTRLMNAPKEFYQSSMDGIVRAVSQ